MSSIKLKHSGGNAVSLNPPSSAPTSTEVAFKLPNADGSAGQVLKTDGSGNLSWVNQPAAGITMVDQWRRAADVGLNNNSNFLTTDWERVDTSGQGTLTGSGGMTESGGIFTFPDEGIYQVSWQGYFSDTGSSEASAVDIYLTTNNSSYSQVAGGFTSIPDTGSLDFGHVIVQTFVDVTDKTQVKVKFRVYSNDSVTFVGSSTYNANCATFIRLGDT